MADATIHLEDHDEVSPPATPLPPHRRSSRSQERPRDEATSPRSPRAHNNRPSTSATFGSNKHNPETAFDILYENQRGTFLLGIPFFSSASLLNFDPPPWVNAHYKPSAVNITNAQVPDPSWEWCWKTWYVDMSHDVDEEGWQYSAGLFSGGKKGGFWAWRGSHPWWCSFVRRRRWVRKRAKKVHHHERETEESRRALGMDSASIGTSVLPSTFRFGSPGGPASEKEEPVSDEIKDVPTLMNALKKAAIDREKISIVRKFIDQGGEELHYFAEKIPSIMGLLVFQSSRRHLLTLIMEEVQSAQQHRKQHADSNKPEGAAESVRIDNLLRAESAAEKEVKKLEYWSDGREVAESSFEKGFGDVGVRSAESSAATSRSASTSPAS